MLCVFRSDVKMWRKGGGKATSLTFSSSSPLVDMSWQHVAAGDLMSGKGLSDQLGVSHLQASTPSVPVWSSVVVSICPSNTWTSCGGLEAGGGGDTLPIFPILTVPGHRRTLLAFLHLKVQDLFDLQLHATFTRYWQVLSKCFLFGRNFFLYWNVDWFMCASVY